MKELLVCFFILLVGGSSALHSHIPVGENGHIIGEQPLSKIAIHKAVLALRDSASIKAKPDLLGLKVCYAGLPAPQLYSPIPC